MKNKKLKDLALLGLASGVLINGTAVAAAPASDVGTPKKQATPFSNQPDSDQDDPNKGNLGYHLMSEDDLLLELTDGSAKTYTELTPEGKALARFVASQRCNGSNECKGLNACQTDTNKCAGQGSCKGTSKCAFADKNLAVKVVAKKMAEKRSNLNHGTK